MPSIYLSEAAPRLVLASESDLQRAVDEGLLVESHYLDLKRELPAGSGRNLEHARDLASFAVDGGTIIVGVQEDRQARHLQLVPQVLSGLRERVEQIARFTPDPPVPVRTHEIPTAGDPSRGYLVVHVPASPLAPHMVDGRYLGRGDATNHRLSDSEVVRLHEQRRSGVVDALALLDREIARDPAADSAWAGPRRPAHLFVVASPLAPRPEMLLPQLKDANVHQLIRAGGYEPVASGPLGRDRFDPDLSAASRYSRRADGTALSTANVLSDRTLAVEPGTYSPEDLVDVEFSEDGAIRVVMTRLSDATGADGSEQQIFDVAAVVYVRRVLEMAVHIADLTGYHGVWQLAVGATGLKGMFPFENTRNTWGLGSSYAFEDDEYRSARVVSYTELLDSPGALTMALLGKFLRKLGTENRHADLTLDTIF